MHLHDGAGGCRERQVPNCNSRICREAKALPSRNQSDPCVATYTIGLSSATTVRLSNV